MSGKTPWLVLAAGAVLPLLFADCMSPVTADTQTIECCGSMACAPAINSHDCCKTVISGPSPSVLAAARVSLNPPLLAIIGHQPPLGIARFAPVIPQRAPAQQHSPPALYTLYGSLLI